MNNIIKKQREVHAKAVDQNWQLWTDDTDDDSVRHAFEAAMNQREAMLDLVEAVGSSACRHTSDMTGDNCKTCQAHAAVISAMEEG